MNMSLRTITTALVLSGIALAGCKKPVEAPIIVDPQPSNEFHFNFDNYFGDAELDMNGATYTTAMNEQITVSTFNYWVSNIKLIKSDGSEFAEEESYRLIRGDKSGTHHFHVENVTRGTYTGIKFTIGVDVARNTSGAQTGALDPTTNGDMYWDWNTGYIQAKLEGTSPQSTATNNMFRYHIGGTAANFETPQEVTLTFPQEVLLGEKAGSAKIKVDLAKWFPTPEPIATTPTMMAPGANALKVAQGYVDMFSITSAGNE